MVTYDDLVSLGEDSCRRFADRPLIGEQHDGSWVWTGYQAFGGLVDQLRGGLADRGIGAGDRVAIVSRNRLEWAVAAYATYGLAATFVPMYEAQRPQEWRFILADCGARLVLGSGDQVTAALRAMQPTLPALAHVIALDGGADDPDGYPALLARGFAHPVPSVRPSPDTIAGYVYTSGTTGQPKGAMLSHRNLASNVAAATAVFPIGPHDRSLSFLPWAHAYGQVAELHILVACGASTALNRDLAHLGDDLIAVRPTVLVAVPRIFNKIYDGVQAQIAHKPAMVRALFRAGLRQRLRSNAGEPLGPVERLELRLADRLIFAKVRDRFGGRLRYAISASASLSPAVAEFIDALGIPVYEGYGLTETSPVVATNRPGARKMGTVGQPIPGVRILIDETASPEPGEGEIIVSGPNVMVGYHDRPEENARAFTAGGDLRTGDLGHLDDDGYLHITGRIKEQYKLENGKYVMPAPLEEQLALSPYLTTVMLHGAGRPYNVALVVVAVPALRDWAARQGLALGDDPDADPRVRALITAELERESAGFRSYERPRDFVAITEELTVANDLLTPTLKLKRRNVLARWGARLDALYAKNAATSARRDRVST